MTRYRLRWSRRGKIRYLSANDINTVLERSVRRAKLPLAYSQGFTPHPKISFATALPVGYGSVAELMDITLTEPLDPDEVMERFNGGLPEDLRIEGAAVLEDGARKLGKVAAAADYEVGHSAPWIPGALANFMELDRYEFVRGFKGDDRVDDLRQGVISASADQERIVMRCALEPRAVRPTDVVTVLATIAGQEPPHVIVERVRLLTRSGDDLVPIDERGIGEVVAR